MIPRLFHRIWLGGEEPEWTRGYGTGWLLMNPGFAMYEWTDENVYQLFPLENQDLFDRAEELFPNHVGQFRSDLLRYEILYRIGGVYIDTDLECLREITPLLMGLTSFAAWEKQNVWIGNTFMGAQAGSPFMHRLVSRLTRQVEERPGQRPARVSGPQYVTREWTVDGTGFSMIFPERLVFPYSWDEVTEHEPGAHGTEWPREAYTVHHWSNQRRERGLAAPS